MNKWQIIIIKDSIQESGNRLTTFELCYPRFIHQEVLTHRVFSRNAASSRAIPIKKFITEINENPAMPVEWGKNRSGMQADEQIPDIEAAKSEWRTASKLAIEAAEKLQKLNLHKQVVNRILEPFQWISVIISATDYENFFSLRCHKDADPTIQYLANLMKYEYNKSIPTKIKRNDWHLPYITEKDLIKLNESQLCMVSAARCARVSYKNHNGTESDIEKDLILANKLKESRHLSPFEHQAKAINQDNFVRNFKGYIQFRSMIE